MLDFARPLQLNDGRKARLLGQLTRCPNFPVVVAVPLQNGREFIKRFRLDGTACGGVRLQNEPRKVGGFINVYPDAYEPYIASVTNMYPTRESANEDSQPGRAACLHVTFEY